MRTNAALAVTGACAVVVVLAGCGSSSKHANAPSTSAPTTRAVTSTTSSVSDPQFAAYIGLSVDAATAKAKADGRASRVIMKDGVPQPATLDYNPDRLNFTVAANKVTKVTTG